MDPIAFDKATEEQKRYASTPAGAFTIISIMVGGFLLYIFLVN